MDSFYVTLPSDSSLDVYPDNTPTKYTTKLKQGATLIGDYEVALAEVQYKFDFDNFVNNELSFCINIKQEDFDRIVILNENYLEPHMPVESTVSANLLKFKTLFDEFLSMGDTVLVDNDRWPQQKTKLLNMTNKIFKPTFLSSTSSINGWLSDVISSITEVARVISQAFGNPAVIMALDPKLGQQIRGLKLSVIGLTTPFQKLMLATRVKRDLTSSEPEPHQAEQPQTANQLTGLATQLQNAVFPSADRLAVDKLNEQLSHMLLEAQTQNRKLTELTETIGIMPFQQDMTHFLKSTSVYSVVPISTIPFSITDNERTFHVPVHFNSGYYKDPAALALYMNEHLRHLCVLKNLNKLVYFTYDPASNKLIMNIDKSADVGMMSLPFAQQLSFSYTKGARLTGAVASKTVHFHERWQLMYIYSDVVDYNHVGHTMAQLLRVIPATGERNAYTVIRFDSPHFLPTLKHDLATLEVQLLNEYGEPFSIKSGKTIIKLQFRPRIKHIF